MSTMKFPETGNITQIHIADALVQKYGSETRFIEHLERWAIYNQTAGWLLDEGLVELGEMWRNTLIDLECQSPSGLDNHSADRFKYKRQKDVLRNSTDSGFSATVRLAQRVRSVRVAPGKVDNYPDLLGCKSGLIDLRTGRLTPHTKEKIIVKRLPIDFDPNATCPRWIQFLEEVLLDQDVIDYVQKVFGYCLTGRTSLQQMWLLVGTGSNGKSTFLNTLQNLLGPDFGQQTPESVLMGKPVTGGSSGELVRLKGIRAAVLTETSYDQQLNENRVKGLISSDVIAARAIYSDFQEFVPEAKFFLATNHLPVVKGSDHGIWRRLVVLQFKQQFETTADSDLGITLASELPGILNWAISGAQKFYAANKKIEMPSQLQEWTKSYRKEQDVISNFLGDTTTDVASERVGASLLYEEYAKWCRELGLTAMTQGEFGSRLKSLGRYQHGRYGQANRYHYQGLRLLTAEEKAKLFGSEEPALLQLTDA